jgi:hypothetical protein
MRREVLIASTGPAGELDDEAFTHEVGAIYALVRHGAIGPQYVTWLRTECYE